MLTALSTGMRELLPVEFKAWRLPILMHYTRDSPLVPFPLSHGKMQIKTEKLGMCSLVTAELVQNQPNF